MRVDQVKHWVRFGGVYHALESTMYSYSFTACGTFANVGAKHQDKPKRVCSKCRAVLPLAKALK